jgi:hypothetical protein
MNSFTVGKVVDNHWLTTDKIDLVGGKMDRWMVSVTANIAAPLDFSSKEQTFFKWPRLLVFLA